MKIAVMGAGAVGCYFGGLLARAGHDVVLVARPAHVQAIRSHGLRLQTRTFDAQVPLRASTEASAVHGAECVLVCVKSSDSVRAAQAMAPHLDPGAAVFSLQNGVDNAERLQTVLERPVAAAVVYVATEMAGPGHVRHHGRGELVLAPSPASSVLAAALAAAGVPVQVSDNVAGALWAKLVLNCAYNAISALTGLSYGPIVHNAELDTAATLADVVRECQAVAAASGIALPGTLLQDVLGLAATMPSQHSSTAQDLARGRRSEIDHLNGFIVRRGEALGIATPTNRLLYTLVRLVEQRQQMQAQTPVQAQVPAPLQAAGTAP